MSTYTVKHYLRRQQGKTLFIFLALLLILSVLGAYILYSPVSAPDKPPVSATEQPETGPNPLVQANVKDTAPVKNDDSDKVQRLASDASKNVAASARGAEEQLPDRRELMEERALQYSEKRQALLQKCRDYDVLGMLEEKKLECLDYLAEKRADQEGDAQQALRKKLRKKFERKD
jgi:hypothetical protein